MNGFKRGGSLPIESIHAPDALRAADPPVAVVTGGASGIGWAIVRRLLGDGWDVTIADIDAGAGAARVEEAGTPLLSSVQLDVSDRARVTSTIEAIGAARGRLDLLVNNAGVQAHGDLETLSVESWTRVLDVDLNGAFHCLQAAGRLMLANGGGAIVNIVSVAAERGAAGRAAYCVSKAGLVSLTRVAAVEWAGRGIRVNAVGPGYIDTPLYRLAVSEDQIDHDEILARIPMARLGQHDEIAAVVAFLASGAASYLTGQVLYADGGFLSDYGVGIKKHEEWQSAGRPESARLADTALSDEQP